MVQSPMDSGQWKHGAREPMQVHSSVEHVGVLSVSAQSAGRAEVWEA